MKKDLYTGGFIINYKEGDRSLQRTKILHTEDLKDSLHVVVEGDTLQNIAFRYYGDSKLWYLIADVNDEIINPFVLKPGQNLLIPNKDRYE